MSAKYFELVRIFTFFFILKYYLKVKRKVIESGILFTNFKLLILQGVFNFYTRSYSFKSVGELTQYLKTKKFSSVITGHSY